MCVVPFDEVRVVAVHRTNQIADSVWDTAVNLARQGTRFRDEFERSIHEFRFRVAREHGFHDEGLHDRQ